MRWNGMEGKERKHVLPCSAMLCHAIVRSAMRGGDEMRTFFGVGEKGRR